MLVLFPGITWSWRALQRAEGKITRASEGRMGQSWAGAAAEMALALSVQLAVVSIGTSVTLSALESVRSGKPGWLGRGLRRAPRWLGWELLVTLQAAARTFVPTLPSPSGADASAFRPPAGTWARRLDLLPVASGIVFYFAKMGLRGYLAVLSGRKWHETAGLARGHYAHIGLLNALAASVSTAGFSCLMAAAPGPGHAASALGWTRMAGVIIGEQIVLSLLAAYGLLLYHDLRRTPGA